MAIDRKEEQTTKCINVTNLKANDRRTIFSDGMNKIGFALFVKFTQDDQTFYVFIYKSTIDSEQRIDYY